MAICSRIEFFVDYGKLVAVILFVAAAVTDFFDGWIARKWNLVTNTGKLLDPVADKMLTMLGFILILGDPIWYENIDRTIIEPTVMAGVYWFLILAVFVTLGRDIIMNSLRFIAAEQGITIAADKLGKLKTITQFSAIVMYMVLSFNLNISVQFIDNGTWLDMYSWTAMFFLGVATVLSIWSCINYIRNYVKSMVKKGAQNGQK
jgi:CDP-diacylglycerol--glycerol-3-phosphate 3-phosphatidyltransferase